MGTKNAESSAFIDFMLETIFEAVKARTTPEAPNTTLKFQSNRLNFQSKCDKFTETILQNAWLKVQKSICVTAESFIL